MVDNDYAKFWRNFKDDGRVKYPMWKVALGENRLDIYDLKWYDGVVLD